MANDFTGDANCMAVWKLNNGVLTADDSPAVGGQGTNTLTNDSVTADTTNKKEGDAAGLFNGSATLSRADADLSVGFPCKNGDTNLKGTVCAWIRPTAITWDGYFSKFDWNGNKGSLLLRIDDAGSAVYRLAIIWGYGGGLFETLGPIDFAFTLDQWYHIGVTWDGINLTNGLHSRVWDDTGTTVYNGLFTPTQTMVADTSTIVLGAMDTAHTNPFTGQIDEVVVFNRRLSSDEIDAIRGGTYKVSNIGIQGFGWESFFTYNYI